MRVRALNVESDHVFHLFDLGVEQRSDGSAAGIVDQHGDARIVLQLCFHPREILLVVGVRYDRSDAASGRAGERCGERLERRLDTYTQTVTTEKRNAQEAVVALKFREKTQE